MALQNLLGVENNQVLIRKYKIIDTGFENNSSTGADGGIIEALFRKHSHEPDDTNYGFIVILYLKEYFIHLVE